MTARATPPILVAAIALAAGLAACAGNPLHGLYGPQNAPRACYWLSNEGAGWVKFPDVETKAQCYDLNSCGPGGGASGGGCYKWATGSDVEGEAW